MNGIACPACGNALVLGERYQMSPKLRAYPNVACKVMYDCRSCSRVFEQWLADDAPLTEWTNPEMIALRAKVMSQAR